MRGLTLTTYFLYYEFPLEGDSAEALLNMNRTQARARTAVQTLNGVFEVTHVGKLVAVPEISRSRAGFIVTLHPGTDRAIFEEQFRRKFPILEYTLFMIQER